VTARLDTVPTHASSEGAVRRLASDELLPKEVEDLRRLFDAAWDGDDPFTDEDWDHALGGLHFILEEDGAIVAHASVVERELYTRGLRLATGYVEAFATSPGHQRRGYGSSVLREVNGYIDETFRLGALGTGTFSFYKRQGWVVWKGPTFVRTDTGLVRTADEDGYVLVRLTPTSLTLDLTAPISCEWRSGDVW
jgi:aminoglycoside 2'-N-acetyltransferase I